MSTRIKRELPFDEYQAAVLSNNASATNVFATIADLAASVGDANRLIFDVKINEVGGITKGQAVYVNGADGTNITVGKADYSTEATSSKTIGLLITTGNNNNQRQVIAEGILKGTGSEPLDTTAGAAGDPVWLGDDGNLIYGLANKPYAPNHLVFIGIVVESNSVVGEIFVKVQNGFELDELHDVDLKSNPPLDGEVLTYNALTDLWEAKPIPGVSSGGTQLLSGGASWSGTGMTFNVSTLTYTIDGVYYTSAPTSVTLAVGDPSNPRFDAIVVDDAGVVSVITGTPAANPIVPSIPGTQVLVQYVLVGAGQVTPSITNEFVYRQGSAPDWIPTFVNTGSVPPTPGAPPLITGSFTSTTPTPIEGAECTLVNAPTYNFNRLVRYQKGSGSIARANFPFLSFRVQLLTGSANRNVLVRLFNGGSFIGNLWASPYGLNLGSLNNWQLVVIPLVAFGNAGQLNVTRVEFAFSGTVATTTQIAFDDIKFQSGFGPQSNTATLDILDSGVVVGSTAKLNFTNGTSTTAVVTQDIPNNKIDVKFDTQAYQIVLNEGTPLTQYTTIDFTGDGVNAFSVPGKTIVNIPGPSDPAFVTTLQAQEVRRGVQATANSTAFQASAGITASVCGTAGLNNLALGNPSTTLIPIPKVRILTTTAAVSAKAGLAWDAALSFPLFYHGKGYRFIGSWVYSDCSSSGLTQYFVPNARQFCGLAPATAAANGVAISSTTAVSSLINIVGVGSDSGEANLGFYYNDAAGTATRIDLGANFPANKTAAVANGEVYTVELYNPCGTTNVYYKVTRLATNTVTTGGVSINVPDVNVGLTPQIIRTSGADSQNVSIDLCQIMCYTAS